MEELAHIKDYAEQFEIEKYLLLDQSTTGFLIHDMIVNPLFLNQVKYILEQTMLLSGASCILYLEQNSETSVNQNSCIQDTLIPIRRRRRFVWIYGWLTLRVQYMNNVRDGIPTKDDFLTNAMLTTLQLLNETRVFFSIYIYPTSVEGEQ